MAGMYVKKIIFLTYQVSDLYSKSCGKVIKMTPFRHKTHHIKIMLINTKILCEQALLLRIRTNFYGTPTINKKVTHFDAKLAFLMLINQNKALFIILNNANKVLCIKIKHSLENSHESVC